MPRIPINIVTGALKEVTAIFGIDLGTTHSLIAWCRDNQPAVIADVDRSPIVPSVVYYPPNDSPVVGEDALPFLTTDPRRTLFSVKRLMGMSLNDLQNELDTLPFDIDNESGDSLLRIIIDDKKLTPIDVSAQILLELKRRTEHALKMEVKQAVVTVPAYFNDAQRQATRDAASLAGIEVLRIINEPTAAALAYGLGAAQEEARKVVVYDLGGGTFDVTVLHIESGIFEVLSTHGNTALGGDDFDHAIVEHWVSGMDLGGLTTDEINSLKQQLRLTAQQAKIHVSAETDFTTHWKSENKQEYELQLSRSQFETLIQALVNQTLNSCKKALKDAELSLSDIDSVILVGGSTRVPFVQQEVGKLFNKQPFTKLDPDQVVALGAAVQADILAGNRSDLLLLDVTPLSLGIETLGGLMDVLITRNSRIPTRAARQYTTSVDGQVNLRITVYQGEREEVVHNRKLAEFELKGIPAMPAGYPKVEIRFLLDADGILQVSAKELRSSTEQHISVKPQYGLNDEEVEKMLLDSMQNAEADIERRNLLEAQGEARQLIYYSEKFIGEHKSLLKDEDSEQIKAQIGILKSAIEGIDRKTIRESIEELENSTRPYAMKVMDIAVYEAMYGKTV